MPFPSADLGRMKRSSRHLSVPCSKQAMSPSTILNPAPDGCVLELGSGCGHGRRELQQARHVEPGGQDALGQPLGTRDVPDDPPGQETSAPGVGSVVVWDQAKSSELFNRLKTGEPLVEKAPRASGPTVEVAPSTISVRILNGSTVSGQGTKAIKEFRATGCPASQRTHPSGPAKKPSSNTTPLRQLTEDTSRGVAWCDGQAGEEPGTYVPSQWVAATTA